MSLSCRLPPVTELAVRIDSSLNADAVALPSAEIESIAAQTVAACKPPPISVQTSDGTQQNQASSPQGEYQGSADSAQNDILRGGL